MEKWRNGEMAKWRDGTKGGGHWGILEIENREIEKIVQNRKTAEKFAQNRKPHTKRVKD